MPHSLNYTNRRSTGGPSYDIRCTGCGGTWNVENAYDPAAQIRTPDGTQIGLLHDTIRFLPARDTFHSRCRACERTQAAARRANGPSRASRRAARTTPGTPLGTSRRFGVELEFGSPVGRDTIRAALDAAGIGAGWRIKGDGSLSFRNGLTGVEISSPVLEGEQGLEQMQTVCRVLTGLGCQVNRSCGTHVHHDAADLTIDNFKQVYRSWFANRNMIDGLVSESRRAGGSYYCQPLTSANVAAVERCTTLSDLRRIRIDRYKTLNLLAYGRYGTLEVRQHQGTLSAEKIRTWIKLGQAIIDTAIADGQPMRSHTSMRSFLGALGSRIDETARTFLYGRTVEFGYAQIDAAQPVAA